MSRCFQEIACKCDRKWVGIARPRGSQGGSKRPQGGRAPPPLPPWLSKPCSAQPRSRMLIESRTLHSGAGGPPRVRSHCRFRNRGTDYISESGMKWMSGGAKRQCDRALGPPLHTVASCVSKPAAEEVSVIGYLGRAGGLSKARRRFPVERKVKLEIAAAANCLAAAA
jgi:hypothetical protein